MKYLLMVLALLAPFSALAEPLRVEAEPLPLDSRDPPDLRLGPLAFLDGLVLRGGQGFGGWSDLLVEGERVLFLGDEGSILTARLDLDAEGRLRGLAEAEIRPLLDEEGRPLSDKRLRDAEAMTRLPDGSLAVAFERRHRLWRYADPTAAAEPLPQPPLLDDLGPTRDNSGLEALAMLPDGRLFGILEGEQGAAESGAFVMHPDGSGYRALSYVLHDDFQVTETAVLPDGDLLVLERFYKPEIGPKARLRHLPAAALEGNAPLEAALWGELAWPRAVDNMEGLAVAKDAQGRTLVYLLSDDNFNPAQRTLLLRFELAYE